MTQVSDRIERLITLCLDGAASETELRELDEALRDSGECREMMVLLASQDARLRRILNERAAARKTKASVSEETGKPAFRRSAIVWSVAAAAALLLAAVGAWWIVRSPRPAVRGPVLARITEAQGGVWGSGGAGVTGRDGETEKRKGELRVGDEVREGMRIETGERGAAAFAYLNEDTRVRLEENAKLSVGGVERGKRLRLELGRLAATVAPQPKGKPFAVETPHARAEVKGTRFSLTVSPARNAPACPPDNREGAGRECASLPPRQSGGGWQGMRNIGADSGTQDSALRAPSSELGMTRLEVFEGLVGLTRLSDGQSVHVATGQYAVAAEGVEIVALALPDGGMPAGMEKTERYPHRLTHLYGKILFEDEFDEGLANWDAVAIDMQTYEVEILAGEPGKHVILKSELRGRNETIKSGVLTNPQGIDERMVGLRSKKHIEAESFVLEARFFLAEKRNASNRFVYAGGIEPGYQLIHTPDEMLRQAHTVSQDGWYYWEFLTSYGPDGKSLLCGRVFSGNRLVQVSHVSPRGTRIVVAAQNQGLVIDKVIVRELTAAHAEQAKSR